MAHLIGAHWVDIEGDLLVLKFHGSVSVEENRAFIALLDELIARHGQCGSLADVRDLGGITPEARRIAGNWQNVVYSYGSACFGASFPIRALLTLLSRAMEIFTRRRHRSPLRFFKTEEEARAWMRAERERLITSFRKEPPAPP